MWLADSKVVDQAEIRPVFAGKVPGAAKLRLQAVPFLVTSVIACVVDAFVSPVAVVVADTRVLVGWCSWSEDGKMRLRWLDRGS